MNSTNLHILGQEIAPGERRTINFNIANLYTATKVEIPVIVERSKTSGPVVLFTGGIHGDEVNGVEIVRQLIQKKINQPKRGTIICIPVLNVFGFLSMNRNFPDGRDLNRVFPGSKNGSLASRFAYQFTNEILPIVDICIDFHTGGSSRFNAPQTRVASGDNASLSLAKVFNAPFLVHSKNIDKTYRSICTKKGKQVVLFEGGKSQSNNKNIAKEGVNGCIRILNELNMLKNTFTIPPKNQSHTITSSKWIRAKYSGLLHYQIKCGDYVLQGDTIATITDPYGKMNHRVVATNDGFIININEAPLVYQGDAIFHISKNDD